MIKLRNICEIMAEWAKIIKTNIMEAALTSFYANEWWTFPNSFSGYSFTNTKTRQRHYKKENYNPTSLTNLDEESSTKYEETKFTNI